MQSAFLFTCNAIEEAINTLDVNATKKSKEATLKRIARETYEARHMIQQLIMAESAEMRLGSDAHLNCEREMMLAFLQNTQDQTLNMKNSALRMQEVTHVLFDVATNVAPAMLAASDCVFGENCMDDRRLSDGMIELQKLLQQKLQDVTGITGQRDSLKKLPDFASSSVKQYIVSRARPCFQFTGDSLVVGAVNSVDPAKKRTTWLELFERTQKIEQTNQVDHHGAADLRKLGHIKRVNCQQQLEEITISRILSRLSVKLLAEQATKWGVSSWWMVTMNGEYTECLCKDIPSSGIVFLREIDNNPGLTSIANRYRCTRAAMNHLRTSAEGRYLPMQSWDNNPKSTFAFALFTVWKDGGGLQQMARVPLVCLASNCGYNTRNLNTIIDLKTLDDGFMRLCNDKCAACDIQVMFPGNTYVPVLQDFAGCFLLEKMGPPETLNRIQRPPEFPLSFVCGVPPEPETFTLGMSDKERTMIVLLSPWVSEYWVRMFWLHLRQHYPLTNDIPPVAIVGAAYVRYMYTIHTCIPCPTCSDPSCILPTRSYKKAALWISPITTATAQQFRTILYILLPLTSKKIWSQCLLSIKRRIVRHFVIDVISVITCFRTL